MRYFATLVCVLWLSLVACLPANASTSWHHAYPQWWYSHAKCLHKYEGSWKDPNAPYYGGLQMDWTFMHKYGGWILNHHGTAEHWPINTQILVAYRGYKRQGFYAWPNTARLCGYI